MFDSRGGHVKFVPEENLVLCLKARQGKLRAFEQIGMKLLTYIVILFLVIFKFAIEEISYYTTIKGTLQI